MCNGSHPSAHAVFEARRRDINEKLIQSNEMKVIYDPETDTLSIIFRKTKISESDELRDGIIIDYGHDGKIVSMEILDASEQVSEPQGIFYELKGKKDVAVK